MTILVLFTHNQHYDGVNKHIHLAVHEKSDDVR